MTRRSIEILFTAALVTITPLSAAAQNERPAIVRAHVYVENGFIVSDVRSHHLFSEPVIGTVESGMPTVVQLLFRFTDGRDAAVEAGIRAYEVGYDVWEDRYLVHDADSTTYYSSFSDMGSAIENLTRIKLIPVGAIAKDAEYRIDFSVAIRPLRSRDREEMMDWMGENMHEVGSSRNQMLNLNDLIHHFFKRERDVTDRSPWFHTEMFRPGRLPVRGASGGEGLP